MRIFSEVIEMQFEVDKCVERNVKKGEKIKSDGIKLQRSLWNNKGHKYLGVLRTR